MLHKVQNWGSISQIESALIECFGRFPLFQAQFVRDSRLQLAPALLLLSLSPSLCLSLSLSLCLVLLVSPYAIQLLQIAPSQLTTSHDDDDNDDGALFSPCTQNTFNSRRSADQAFPHIHTLSLFISLSLSLRPWTRQMILGKRKHWGYFSADSVSDSDSGSGYGVRAMHTWLVLDKFIIE